MPPVRGGHLLGGLITPIKINHSHESDGSVINILNLMDVAMDKTDASGTRSGVCDYLYTLCQQSFPSPLVCGNVGSREVNKWIDEKIANCKSPDMDHRKGFKNSYGWHYASWIKEDLFSGCRLLVCKTVPC